MSGNKTQDLPPFIRYFMIISGTILAGVGFVGIFVPLLPSTPFFLAASILYGRSSKRFYSWLMGVPFVKKQLHDLTIRKGLTIRSKIRILITALIVMAISALIIGKFIVYIILALAFGIQLFVFLFIIKTIPESAV